MDLDLPLGDAALDLGITPTYSTVNALQNFSRLDSNFLLTLLTKHSSGLSVLAAPDKYTDMHASEEAVEKLLTVTRQEFDYVVVDAGSRLGTSSKALFHDAAGIYLVTQVSIPELRNSNRLITDFFGTNSTKLEVILNRYSPRSLGIDEEHITKRSLGLRSGEFPAIFPRPAKRKTRPAQLCWRIRRFPECSGKWQELHAVFRRTEKRRVVSQFLVETKDVSKWGW